MELYVAAILLGLILVAQIVILLRGNSAGKEIERSERSLRDEISRSRTENQNSLKGVGDSLIRQLAASAENQQNSLSGYSRQITELTSHNHKVIEQLRQSVENKLVQIQKENGEKLESMRKTVDEQLQSVLEKRLSESFKLVSERLEQVYKGLGEMQTLAAGVGDLKKMLTNVKTRGTWGEIQLGAMLEQVFSPDQYKTNVSPKNNRDLVEFAIVLPGKGDDDVPVLLPIDAKFPVEDYQRLIEALEKNDAPAADASAKALENAVKNCAKDIRDKYLAPPATTDFGILYLPTEGLFAEVVRRPGLIDQLQRDYRVIIAGPTTLWAILTSLQMGFRTLAIEKRSSEVWKLLEAVKTEWAKYDGSLETLRKQLNSAVNSIDRTQTRVRIIGKKLRGVHELKENEAEEVLQLQNAAGEEDDSPEEASLELALGGGWEKKY